MEEAAEEKLLRWVAPKALTGVSASQPVTGPASQMGNSDDLHARLGDTVDQGKGEAAKEIAAGSVIVARPAFRIICDDIEGMFQIIQECFGSARTSLRIPLTSEFSFIDCLALVLENPMTHCLDGIFALWLLLQKPM